MSYKEKIDQDENQPKQSFLEQRKNRFSDRLRVVMKGDTNVSFAEKVGITETTVRRYLAGGSVPNIDVLERISDATGYEVGWLASGKGPQRVGDIRHEEVRDSGVVQLPDDFVLVNDMRSVETTAGYGAEVTTALVDGRMAFRRDWVTRQGLNPHALCIIRAKGDSMEPTIQDGDPLLVESFSYVEQQGNKHHIRHGRTPEEVVKQDGIYAIQLHERLVVKRLQLDMMGGLLVKSDNPTYDTLHVPAERLNEISVIGRVVWTGRKL